MTRDTVRRLLLPIAVLIDGIRVARGVTGGHNTDDLDRRLLKVRDACDELIAHLLDQP